MKDGIKSANEQLHFREAEILLAIKNNGYQGQRMLAEETGYSLGVINNLIKRLQACNMITEKMSLTDLCMEYIEHSRPENAIILAAGYGMRMVPVNLLTPKALLEVNGDRLIERIITQLHENGIRDITVVTGFMKESFEYLIDKYNVDLVYNKQYAEKNNLLSLWKVRDRLKNTYIIPCDIWCRNNPFHEYELYSWYMVTNSSVEDSKVRVNRKMELVKTDTDGCHMIGISYLRKNDAELVRDQMGRLISSGNAADYFWEESLYRKNKMIIPARIIADDSVAEINTYEDLRELDSASNTLKSDAIDTICNELHVKPIEITNIRVLKKGMTNRSFLFQTGSRKYIMRIPGEGTDKMINRENEAIVYSTIRDKGLCDDPVYLNPANGYKITAFLENVRTCNTESEDDLKRCMRKLKDFHEMKLIVPHEFDIISQINLYESFWKGESSIYQDHAETKENVMKLKKFIDLQDKDYCLTHIDAVCDNFLFYSRDGDEELQLTDWEYSGMQDPHVDIAMFCIYSLFGRIQIDHLIDIYFEGNCSMNVRTKIYCYIAMCGLLWSDWCEYKRQLGVEFGEYSLRQYRYAKDYYRFACENMKEMGISI